MDTIANKLVDNFVDDALNDFKKKAELQNTNIYTCISKETHSGKTLNLIFYSNLGNKLRIPYSNLDSFCKDNYVSNVMIGDRKPRFIGIRESELPEYKLQTNGTFTKIGRNSEESIYSKCTELINQQYNILAQDIRNGTLKGVNSSSEIKTNFTKNISSIKGITDNVNSITANIATAASAAAIGTAVVGVGAAAKGVYKKLNRGKVVELQKEICIFLKDYNKTLSVLYNTKIKTNNIVRNNNNIITYSNSMEASNDITGYLKNDINTLGVNALLNRLEKGLEKCISKAKGNDIINDKMNFNGIPFGTLSDYLNDLANKINKVKQLHLKTKNLINNNIELKNMRDAEEAYLQQIENEKELFIDHCKKELIAIEDNLDIIREYGDDELINHGNNLILLAESLNNLNNQYIQIDNQEFIVYMGERISILDDNIYTLQNKIDNILKNKEIENIRNIINNEYENLHELRDKVCNINIDNMDKFRELVNKLHVNISFLNSRSFEIGSRELLDEVNSLKIEVENTEVTINDTIKSIENSIKDELEAQIVDVENYINSFKELLVSNIDLEELIDTANNKLDKIINRRDYLKTVKIYSYDYNNRINRLKEKLSNARNNTEFLNIKSDIGKLNTLKLEADQILQSSSTITNINNITNNINNLMFKLRNCRFKSVSINNSAVEYINDIVDKINNRIDILKDENLRLEREKQNKAIEIKEKINNLINKIDSFSKDIKTENDIEELKNIKNSYNYMTDSNYSLLDYDNKLSIRELYNTLNSKANEKIQIYSDIVRRENNSLKSINNDILNIRHKINTYSEKSFTMSMNDIHERIKRIKESNEYINIQDTTDIDNKINNLMNSYTERVNNIERNS